MVEDALSEKLETETGSRALRGQPEFAPKLVDGLLLRSVAEDSRGRSRNLAGCASGHKQSGSGGVEIKPNDIIRILYPNTFRSDHQ